jgi:DNA-binding transcriptional regulator YdaS (Cro superfamily)
MATMKKSIVILALALELAVATTATAATVTAKSRGHQARAQAIEDVTEGGVSVSPERVRALRECNARVEGFKGHNAMITPVSMYRSCMADHGQPE